MGYVLLRAELLPSSPPLPACCLPSSSPAAGRSLCPHLLLLQADDGAVAAAAPLPLERCDLLRFDAQDFLLLLLLQLQLLWAKSSCEQLEAVRPAARGRGTASAPR